jgi:hypothetical protein
MGNGSFFGLPDPMISPAFAWLDNTAKVPHVSVRYRTHVKELARRLCLINKRVYRPS